jgi:hypothetical protein
MGVELKPGKQREQRGGDERPPGSEPKRPTAHVEAAQYEEHKDCLEEGHIAVDLGPKDGRKGVVKWRQQMRIDPGVHTVSVPDTECPGQETSFALKAVQHGSFQVDLFVSERNNTLRAKGEGYMDTHNRAKEYRQQPQGTPPLSADFLLRRAVPLARFLRTTWTGRMRARRDVLEGLREHGIIVVT